MAVTRHTHITATKATYYAPKFEGKTMADGKPYLSNSYTCAYNSAPLGSWLRLANPLNGATVTVQNTDRKGGPGIDLSRTVYNYLGLSVKKGSGLVLITELKDYNEGME